MKNTYTPDVLILGGGTAGTNAARQAVKAGAKKVVVVHKEQLTNTCVEEGCMPSKSILAAGHANLSIEQTFAERDAHIDRLMKALTSGIASEQFEIIVGDANFNTDGSVSVSDRGEITTYTPKKTIIATGSTPFVPSIQGLHTLGNKMLISDDIVAKNGNLKTVPKRILVLGGGPIGLEMATFLHTMGSHVEVLERSSLLGLYDEEFGTERVRASMAKGNFLIRTDTSLAAVENTNDGVLCSIGHKETTTKETFDAVLIATGRKPSIGDLQLENTNIKLNERGHIIHNEFLETNHTGIFVAGDATGHHQILHYAAEMGKVTGHNVMNTKKQKRVDYDKFMLAISFDQFPSAMIGLTEKEAVARGIKVVTATRHFRSIGLGILKRQEFGMWKLVADKETGQILGSQILGPDSAGELIQILVPIIHNRNTYGAILNMPWYHPTFGEILKSLANDMCKKDATFCPGM